MLSNLLLQRILDEAADDDEKKKKEAEKEQEEDTEGQEADEGEEEETSDEAEEGEGEPEENPDDPDAETPEGEEPAAEDGETPAEGEETSEDGVAGPEGEGEGEGDGFGEFSMDGDDSGEEDLGPAPDGLPEADDDGSGDMEEEDPDGETNIQTNILKLSKLDRALAKKTVGENLVSLRSTINAALGVIDRNESVIDPDVRDLSVNNLNNLLGELETFILHKFPILNYEDSLTQYLVFAKKVNDAVEYVKTDGVKGGKKQTLK